MGTFTNYKMFKCFNRKFTISKQAPPPDVKEAFSAFAGGEPSMSADKLRRFLLEHQGESDCTAEDSNRIVENALQSRKRNQESGGDAGGDCYSGGAHEGLTLHEFFHFLFLDDFNGPLKSQVCPLLLFNCLLSHCFFFHK